jgi:hypothetical protein
MHLTEQDKKAAKDGFKYVVVRGGKRVAYTTTVAEGKRECGKTGRVVSIAGMTYAAQNPAAKAKRRNPATFGDLSIGQEFDFVSGTSYDSFYDRCVKTGARTYKPIEGKLKGHSLKVGSIKAKVYHVGGVRNPTSRTEVLAKQWYYLTDGNALVPVARTTHLQALKKARDLVEKDVELRGMRLVSATQVAKDKTRNPSRGAAEGSVEKFINASGQTGWLVYDRHGRRVGFYANKALALEVLASANSKRRNPAKRRRA